MKKGHEVDDRNFLQRDLKPQRKLFLTLNNLSKVLALKTSHIALILIEPQKDAFNAGEAFGEVCEES